MRYRKTFLLTLMVVFFSIIFISVNKREQEKSKVIYKSIRIKNQVLKQDVNALGKMDAIKKVDIGTQASGQLDNLYVAVGDVVKRGDLLGTIDPEQALNNIRENEEDLSQLQAQLDAAVAEENFYKNKLNRNFVLLKKKIISEDEYEKNLTDMVIKSAMRKSINSQISKGKVSLDIAKNNLKYTKLIAPMDGEVVIISIKQGQTIISSQQAPNILTIADLTYMMVEAKIPEDQISRIKKGQKVSFEILGEKNKTYHSTIEEILPTAEYINSSVFYTARFKVSNETREFKQDMTALVRIYIDNGLIVPTIPISFLGEMVSKDKYKVKVKVKDKVEQRVIITGEHDDFNIQVTSGVKVDEEIVVENNNEGENHGSD